MGPWFVVMVIVDIGVPPLSGLSAADRLERQPATVHGGAADRLDDPLRLGGRDLDEREALEHADVADGLAVEAAAGGDRGDQLAGLQAGGAARVGDQLRVARAVALARVMRLAVAARLSRGFPGGDRGA